MQKPPRKPPKTFGWAGEHAVPPPKGGGKVRAPARENAVARDEEREALRLNAVILVRIAFETSAQN